ncbi:Flagellar hook-length control protein FliK [Bacillus sp. THAF10]|uniref:hypothetical protein n=1 Tax=Bacillus sp. THAF10 TaxID=2587848 RepID=UPI001268B364|nr:hypothetical protein [Bacillus sp. THAF10]QFT88851.1 Flagellar hook-length control protein FliK [Bacillus sp. THAF10]
MNIWQLLQAKIPNSSISHVVRDSSVVKEVATTALLSSAIVKEQSPLQGNLTDVHKTIEILPPQKKGVALAFVGEVLQRSASPLKVNELPGIIKAMFDSQTFSESLTKLEVLLSKTDKPTPVQQQLISLLKSLPLSFSDSTTIELVHQLKTSFTKLGLNFENSIASMLAKNQALTSIKMEQLKPLLIEYLHSLKAPSEKAIVSAVLSKIAGFQLLSKEDANMGQWFIPFPMQYEEKRKDWYIHINARKREGAIDPDYCRIVLFLDMPIFSTLMLDMFVQNKSVNLHIQHEYPPLAKLIENSANTLKESLTDQGYVLTSVKTEFLEKEATAGISLRLLERVLTPPEKGLDIRV